MIKALSQNLSRIGLFIDVIPKENQTIEYIIKKIKEAAMMKNETKEKLSVSTFNSTSKNGKKSFICKKRPHKKGLLLRQR